MINDEKGKTDRFSGLDHMINDEKWLYIFLTSSQEGFSSKDRK